MKNIFKKTITWILLWQSRIILKKYKPKIVAVTGSVGKTSTKDCIYTALLPFFHVRKSAKSYNSEIGLPLTIIGAPNAWSSARRWIKNILMGFSLILKKKEYPEWLVLEIGADRPGDIKKITKWLKPDISVITRIGKVPVHVEFYKSVSDVIREKSELAKAVKKDGVLILNSDDEDVLSFKEYSKARSLTYGIEKNADILGSHYQISYDKNKKVFGMSMRADIGGSSIPVNIEGVLGRQQLYPILAAFAVAESQKLNLIKVSEAFSIKEISPGRMNIVEGRRGSVIIDDTYNASPVALLEGLNTLKEIKCSGRKIAILGDMLELGKFSKSEHKSLGEVAGKISDVLAVVGIRAKGFAEGAIEAGLEKNNIFYFEKSLEAGEFLKTFISDGDVVYVKGSQGMRMERTVESLMAHPYKKGELLVRQDAEWLDR